MTEQAFAALARDRRRFGRAARQQFRNRND
jgi:hypothetical protein